MSAVNQKEYLKRYLSKGKDKKKKKKNALKGIQNRVKIIDDNLDIQEHMQTIQDIENNDEDAPQVVAIIDDRPVELRLESFKDNSNWTTVDIKPQIKKEPDDTPPHRNSNNGDDYSPQRRGKEDDQNQSPPRTKKNGSLIDHSPPRRRQSDDYSPPRKNKRHESSSKTSRDDYSPSRRNKNSVDASPPRRQRNQNQNDSDESPPRRRKESPRRKENDNSPPRMRNVDSSPPRRKHIDSSSATRKNIDNSPPRRKTNSNSPSRRRKCEKSLPRRRQNDTSPPRKTKIRSSPSRNNRDRPSSSKKSRWSSRSPEPQSSSQEKATKTLDGKAAGLQNAKDLVKETENFRKREAKLFESMPAEVSGAGSSTVIRDRKTGKVRDLEAEALAKAVHKEKASALQKQYDEWGKGVKQTADYKAKLEQDAYEMTKPLARYADDEDLEKYLKEQERLGDPMLQYIRKKKRDGAVSAGVPLKPLYEGAFMPNRFGIRPGHKWDGVDRSNGYERKWFDAINKRNAQREEAYKWNSEDM